MWGHQTGVSALFVVCTLGDSFHKDDRLDIKSKQSPSTAEKGVDSLMHCRCDLPSLILWIWTIRVLHIPHALFTFALEKESPGRLHGWYYIGLSQTLPLWSVKEHFTTHYASIPPKRIVGPHRADPIFLPQGTCPSGTTPETRPHIIIPTNETVSPVQGTLHSCWLRDRKCGQWTEPLLGNSGGRQTRAEIP